MIEANENIDLVTMRRQQEVQQAQHSYQQAVSEGRLAVRPRQGESADGRAAPVAADYGGAGRQAATSAPIPEATTSVPPPQAIPADPEVAWRHTRLAVTAGLVLLLLVVWIWQKKSGR